ncbi:MAG: CRISPR-associated helicase Cas3' [Clostridioides sp.]|jgi:CRISPR-associated endonuclease/helicase Cas3|nr:CRISPR-associated helicase Cas3' [Clostridioides sp.]
MEDEFISRKEEVSGKISTELVRDHLLEVAERSKNNLEKIGLANVGYLVGLLHDIGKYSDSFQERIKSDIDNGAIHSQQGAKFILEQNSHLLLKEMMAQVIFAHHGGLLDGIDRDASLPMYDKLANNEDKLEYETVKERFKNEFPEMDFEDLFDKSEKELSDFLNKNFQDEILMKERYFYLNLLTKVIYSSVVDADRTCAYKFTIGENQGDNLSKMSNNKQSLYKDSTPRWDILSQNLEENLAKFTDECELDKMRQKISNQCLERGLNTGVGAYQLNVPTGGGKTFSSLRFALNHAEQNKKNHIIYVIPYLSVLDQTAKNIKMALNYKEDDNYILEHHSNVLPQEVEEKNNDYRLLTSSWQSPIIITTIVRFLESIYSNKGSDLRKFHNMANSVIIFDEVQALPVKCTHLFNLGVNFLTKMVDTTVLLCTATQPILDKVKRPVLLHDKPNLVELSDEELSIFKRTNIVDKTQAEYTAEILSEFIEQQVSQNKNTLAIFNTKKQAEEVFKEVNKIANCKAFFLSTSLCAAHRLEVLKQVKVSLKNENEITVLVSTQIVEAGVDISFECVIRAQAGLDNIVQAAGRCNRNGEFNGIREVFVVKIKDEDLSRLQSIKQGRHDCKRIFGENHGADFSSKKCLEQYYDYYFFEFEDELDYKVGNKTIYELLSDNYNNRKAYENVKECKFRGLSPAFKEASEKFSVIDKNQVTVIVPYNDEAENLIGEFTNLPKNDFNRKKSILKQLQRYSVSMYNFSIKKLEEENAIFIVADSFIALKKNYYNEELGVVFNATLDPLFI